MQRVLLAALVALAAVDVIHPIAPLHEIWWITFFLLWTLRSDDLAARTGFWGQAAVVVAAVLVCGWLVDQTHRAFMSTVDTWTIFGSIPGLGLLSYPMHDAIVAVLVAAVTVATLRRVVGRDLLFAAALFACLPLEIRLLTLLFTPSPKPLVVPIRAFAAVIPVLAMAEAASLLARNARSHVIGGIHSALREHLVAIYRSRWGGWLAVGWFLALRALLIPVMRWWWEVFDGAPSRTAVALHFVLFSLMLYGVISAVIYAWQRLKLTSNRPLATNIACLFGYLTILVSAGLLAILLVFTIPRIGYTIERIFKGPQWELSITRQAGGVRLSGVLNRGVSKAVAKVLGRDPKIRFIELDSPGGNVGDGMAVASLVRKYGLDTYVKSGEECASACTDIFVVGRKRIIGAGAKLGFHRGISPFWDDQRESDESAARAVQYFVRHGVQNGFAEHAESIPPNRIWKPSTATLTAAGVITGVLTQLEQNHGFR